MARALSGPDLPPPLALMARLLAATMLVELLPFIYPEPFLPFLRFFDALRPYGVFRPAMTALCAAGLAGVFLTRRLRASCLLMGGSLLLSILASKEFYSNGKVFLALMLLLLGLHDEKDGRRYLRRQFVVLYAGCFLSKALDADWWSGRYFDAWLAGRLGNPLYAAVASVTPPLWFARFLSWTVIVGEAALAWLYAVRADRAAVPLTVLFHGGILVILGGATFGGFFYAVLASLLVFADWPGEGEPSPLSDGARPSFDDVRRALLYTPGLYFVLYAVLLPSPVLRTVLVAALMALFAVPFEDEGGGVVLYDGECGLCDRWVRFVLGRDARARFKFAPLQGEYARGLLAARGLDASRLDTVYVVLDPGGPREAVLSKSKAVFATLGRLGGLWRLASPAGSLPAAALDPIYDLVAGVRYRLFGRFDACPVPEARWRARFIA